MRIAEAFSWLTAALREWESESPFVDAELMLMHFLKLERTDLHLSPEKDITPDQWQDIRAALERRLAGEPMAYIVGHKYFYKQAFLVTPAVLIPRPETELIVETAVERGPFAMIADLGSGSGCIGLSLLAEFPEARLWACDISPQAMSVLEANARALGLMDRVTYSIGDVSLNPAENIYDLVVANPPYISESDDRVEAGVRQFEPATALFAGDDGLAFYRAWLPWAYRALRTSGSVLFEFGEGQGAQVEEIARAVGFKNLELKKDLAGKERMLAAQKSVAEGIVHG